MDIEIKSLENKLKNCKDLEPELKILQDKLHDTIDSEKELFDENLRLLGILKDLQMKDQENSYTKQEKELYLTIIIDQHNLER